MDFEIIFNCPECGAEVSALSSTAGQILQCGACFKNIIIPIPGLEEGLEIGDFVLQSKLGSGGMGEVWLATQLSMRRLVALKILLPKFAENKQFVKRFLAEAAMAGQLSHPNIITAFSAGQVGNYYYLATSYIDGIEVATKLKLDTKLTERDALKIARDIAFALKYAWDEHKILHRDVKPGNFLQDRKGFTRLMDMGISKSLKDSSEETATNMVMGTPDYISPEQAMAQKNIDFRSDIYSLGASLYHMVCGRPPFQADSAAKILKMHVKTQPELPESVNPAISKECSALIQKMMSKSPADRQASWDYVIDDIEAVLSGRAPGRKSLGLFGRINKPAADTSRPDDIISLKGKAGTFSKIRANESATTADVTLAMNADVTVKMEPVGEAKSDDETVPAPDVKPAVAAAPKPPPRPKPKTVPPRLAEQKKKFRFELALAAVTVLTVLLIIGYVIYRFTR
jgi:serine/threonine-protein kinase